MILVLALVYGILVFVSLTNLLLMRRPQGAGEIAAGEICFEVMVPARNEAHNLPLLIPPLVSAGVKVTVFDDESSDGTADVARSLGATVIRPREPLPAGWTGKTRACHELSLHAVAPWVVFLDADVRPDPNFPSCFSSALLRMPKDIAAVSGFPRMIPGAGIEPAYLGWVPWILLATNPFGIVSRTGRGHNRFMNGQIGAWPMEVLQALRPYEAVKGEVLEDVKIGRLLAAKGKRVEILNLRDILAVHMYPDLNASFKGMCKNSCEIAPGFLGSLLFASLFLFFGLGWLFGGHLLLTFFGMLLLSKILSDRVIRYPVWTFPLLPLTCIGAAWTILFSTWLKGKGRVEWKGRRYG